MSNPEIHIHIHIHTNAQAEPEPTLLERITERMLEYKANPNYVICPILEHAKEKGAADMVFHCCIPRRVYDIMAKERRAGRTWSNFRFFASSDFVVRQVEQEYTVIKDRIDSMENWNDE